MRLKIWDRSREGKNGDQDQRKGGNNGTEVINSRVLQYRNRQFPNIEKKTGF